jgi:Beta-galactosidase/beta-glucuronidase
MKKQKPFLKALFLTAFLGLLISFFPCLNLCSGQPKIDINARTVSFDVGWHFLKDSLSGAENPDFNDSNWRILDLPHDWSIGDLSGQNGENIIGPFDKSSIDKMSSGYLVGGIGWYRKSFTVKSEDKDKKVYLQFEGVYMNSDVWLNGKHLGFHPYGYTPFYYNLTSFLNPAGQPNVVAVRVRNEGLNSRWYSGSGINRHVWLTVVNPVHIDISGSLYITSSSVSENSAEVKIGTTLVNTGPEDKNIVLQTQLFDPSGKPAGSANSNSSLKSGQSIELIQNVAVKKPALWSIEEPNLYQAKVSVLIDGRVIDKEGTLFGIRSLKIDAQNGLLINGKPVDMIGGCYHLDNGPLGAVSINRAEERKIEILKGAGFNAIRTSHNPPSPELLDACDRLGMVVIDEIFDMWETPKKEKDYHLYFREWWQKDVESWVKRDRNHPSVIIWSIGNEIRETFDTSGLRIARNLTGEIRQFDQTRSITEAFNDFAWMRGQKSKWDSIPEHMGFLDVVGYNYAYKRYEEDHIKYPNRVMVGTETNPPLALENYEMVKKHPYVIGYFVWTAIDNIGEAGVGMPQLIDITKGTIVGGPPAAGPGGGFFRRDPWPVFNNYQGDIDLIGNRKVPSYYQFVVWGKSKVEMFVHRPIPEGKKEVTSPWGFPDELKSWNWPGREGEKFQVHVYTRSLQVKLELNGRIIGEQTVDQGKSITATFEVRYEKGTLIAHCYDNGKETASQALMTTGKPFAIRLIADRTIIRADRNDLSYVRAEIIDSEGNIVPDADDILVNFEITGNGKVAGVGSGNPGDMSSFQQPRKKAYQGICLAIIRPDTTPGKISLRATAGGLKEGSVVITTK